MRTALSGDYCNDGECLNFVARLGFADEERPLHSLASVKVRSLIFHRVAAKYSVEFSANRKDCEIRQIFPKERTFYLH